MILEEVRLQGFRNFADATVRLAQKTLVIGANDIGKSNFLYALRILLDRNLSEADLEPKESDFCVFESCDELSITLKFSDVDEDCVLAKMKGHVSDEGSLYLQYRAFRGPVDQRSSYSFYAGHSEDSLEEIQSRFYLKVLNLRYLSSNRDLPSYVRREKKYLLYDAKQSRTEEERNDDAASLDKIKKRLKKINDTVKSLNYIKTATSELNTELTEIAFHRTKEQVVFDVGATDPEGFTQNLRLATERDGRVIEVGGDGVNNQIFLALWSSRHMVSAAGKLEVTIHCIEEPEAHLHPHQQRKLAQYLTSSNSDQVLITSHSPQIAAEFSPNSIVRLCATEKGGSAAASKGCSDIVENAFLDFGYRLNAINAETFYANAVFLVEGPSEVLFFKALARELGIDLDRLNMSVTMVDGVGFMPYVKILDTLEVPWVIRTDNDVMKVPRKEKYRLAGFQRALEIAKSSFDVSVEDKRVFDKIGLKIGDLDSDKIPKELKPELKAVRKLLRQYMVLLSKKDLEHDLSESKIRKNLEEHYGEDDSVQLVAAMQKRKATGMFDFLTENHSCLKSLSDSQFHKQLKKCVGLVTEGS